jgi:hypothetical protein
MYVKFKKNNEINFKIELHSPVLLLFIIL